MQLRTGEIPCFFFLISVMLHSPEIMLSITIIFLFFLMLWNYSCIQCRLFTCVLYPKQTLIMKAGKLYGLTLQCLLFVNVLSRE